MQLQSFGRDNQGINYIYQSRGRRYEGGTEGCVRGGKSGLMNLGDTRTSPCGPLYLSEDFVRTPPTELFSNDAFYLLPIIPWRVVKEASEFPLELGRQYGGLHSDSLSDLEIESTVRSQKIIDALRITRMESNDRLCEGRVGLKVDFVICRDDCSCYESPEGPQKRRGIPPFIGNVYSSRTENKVRRLLQIPCSLFTAMCGEQERYSPCLEWSETCRNRGPGDHEECHRM